MSVLSDLMYGELADVQNLLEEDLPTLEETQGALINALRHIRGLEGLLQNAMRDVDYLKKKGGAA